MDRRSFLSLLAASPVAVAIPIPARRAAELLPGGEGNTRAPVAIEDIAAMDFVAVTGGGWAVRADGAWPEVVGVALLPARVGETVLVQTSGVVEVNRG